MVDGVRIGMVLGHGKCNDENASELSESIKQLAEVLGERLSQEQKTDSLASEIINVYQELNLLYELTESLSGVLDVKRICEIVLNHATDIIEPEQALFFLLDDAGEKLKPMATIGMGDDTKMAPVEVRDSIYSEVIEKGGPVVTKDIHKAADSTDEDEQKDSSPDTSIMCVPVSTEGHVFGVISMIGKQSGATFTSEDTKLLAAIALQAGMSLGNARLYDEQHKMFLGTVEALAAATEAKDTYTIGHCRRVAEYAVRIGQEMGLPSAEIANLRLAGILHDIGKIGMSESVLRKKHSGFTRADLAEMTSHPVKGAEIIGHVEQLKDIALWIRHHHENYDGTGYPDKLTGEDIPLHSRILAVADAYDTLTSDRGYNAKYPYDIPIVKLSLRAGSYFDPGVVAVFLNLIRENGYKKYLEEYEKRGDPESSRLNRVAYYRADNEIINILTREAQGESLSEDERERLESLRKLVLRS